MLLLLCCKIKFGKVQRFTNSVFGNTKYFEWGDGDTVSTAAALAMGVMDPEFIRAVDKKWSRSISYPSPLRQRSVGKMVMMCE